MCASMLIDHASAGIYFQLERDHFEIHISNASFDMYLGARACGANGSFICFMCT